MPDPYLELKRAFHYALEGDEELCKHTLHGLTSEELQDVALAAGLLKTWAMAVFDQPPLWGEDA